MKKIIIIPILLLFLTACSWNFWNKKQDTENLENDQNNSVDVYQDNQEISESPKERITFNEITGHIENDLPDWDDHWQEWDENFTLNNFRLVSSDVFELGESKEYYKELTDLEKEFYKLSPDQTRYLDIYGDVDVYESDGKLYYENETVEFGPNEPPEGFFDFQSSIVNVVNNTSQEFLEDHGVNGAIETTWLSDNEFLILGSRYVSEDSGLIPTIKYFNIDGKFVKTYESEFIRSCERLNTCPEDMMTIKLYFTSCLDRVTIEKEISIKKTKQVAEAALKELFKGPFFSDVSEYAGDKTFLLQGPNNVEVKGVKIIDNIAYVNLNDIRPLFSSSDHEYAEIRNCEEFSFFEQATRTLKQFPTIKDAIYFIEGKTYLFYDFIGIDCPGNLCKNNPFESEMQETFVYYNSCNEPVRQYLRLIPKSENKVEATLKEEFKGPYAYESYYGVGGLFALYSDIELLGLEIKDDIAYVNINNYTINKYDLSHHCSKAQFFASVGAALTQFPEIKDSIYFFDGDLNAFYNYMNVDCPYPKACLYNPFK